MTEEKFAMLLYTFFVVGDLSFCVHVQTNPAVVIVHGNQYANAVATILWDNFFGEKGREPFVVPDSVPWSLAGMALNNHFGIYNHMPLRDSDLIVLKQKVLGIYNFLFLFCQPKGNELNLFHSLATNQEGMLTWAAFNRETLPQRTFTFWEWFFGIEELVKKHLHGPWCDKYDSHCSCPPPFLEKIY